MTTSHSGEDISVATLNILTLYETENKVVTAVTDNAENMKKAISKDLKKHNHFCVAHTLNLSVQDAIKENKDLETTLCNCRALVTYFKKSNLASYKLKEVQQQMNLPLLALIQDISTRWNSELSMLERLLELRVPITVTLASLENAARNLDLEEWTVVQEVIPVLKPLLLMTEKLSGELYPTMSLIVPLIRGLQKSLKKKETTTTVAS